MKQPRLLLIIGLLAFSVAARLAPYVLSLFGVSIDPSNTIYPWNLSPVLPICIFGGAFFARKRLVYGLPLATFLLGDLGIWALTGDISSAFYANQPVVYLSIGLIATTGFALKSNCSWSRVASAGLVSSIGFYIITNFGVWAFGDGSIYPHTSSGLAECYVQAIPYFRNTVISMALFLPVLFSRLALRDTIRAQTLPAR